MALRDETLEILTRLGVDKSNLDTGNLAISTPLTGETIASVPTVSRDEASQTIDKAHQAFLEWRSVPAPKRGELIRLLGEEIRAVKDDLGKLVSIEAGKIPSEGVGEVQEMIDICEFAVGLSRQLYGLTIASERPAHKMLEVWHPLGAIGVISAFNFPIAVWCWNAAIALVCGNAVIWKPSEKTPLTALACKAIYDRAAKRFVGAPDDLVSIVIGERDIGEVLVDHEKVPLVSATGSTEMGRQVGPRLARRFARAILELGGNNAGIVCPSADLGLALRAIVFSAVGTTGQRCTSHAAAFRPQKRL